MDPAQPENPSADPPPPLPPPPLPAEPWSPENAAAVPVAPVAPAASLAVTALPDPIPSPPPPLSARYEQWLMANLAPLGVIVFSLAIVIALGPYIDTKMYAKAAAEAAALPNPERPQRVTWPNLGVLCLLCLMSVYFFKPEARRWVKQFTPRALPAFRVMDLLALLIGSKAVATLLVLASQRMQFLSAATGHISTLATEMILGDIIFLSVVVLAIWLSRVRAGGPKGSLGVWPFWTLIQGERSVFKDMTLGVLCYPVFFLGLSFLGPLGYEVAEFFGQHPKQHPLLLALKQHLQPWELAVFVVSSTLGAAFFEELMFRGVLYNGLRRYFGAWFGAMLAVLLFAVMHPVGDWLGIFFLGMILTWLYDKTGRLVASMTLHLLNNTLAVLFTLYQQGHFPK